MKAIDGSFTVSFILWPLQAPFLWRLSFEAGYHFLPESFWLVSSWCLQAVGFSPPSIVLCSISVFLMPLFSGSLFSSCLCHNFFHLAADGLPHVAFEGDRELSVCALDITCCLDEQLCCSSGAAPQQSYLWCEMLLLLTHVCAHRHCSQSCTQAKRCTCGPSVRETLCVSSRLWCHDLILGQKSFLLYQVEGLIWGELTAPIHVQFPKYISQHSCGCASQPCADEALLWNPRALEVR